MCKDRCKSTLEETKAFSKRTDWSTDRARWKNLLKYCIKEVKEDHERLIEKNNRTKQMRDKIEKTKPAKSGDNYHDLLD